MRAKKRVLFPLPCTAAAMSTSVTVVTVLRLETEDAVARDLAPPPPPPPPAPPLLFLFLDFFFILRALESPHMLVPPCVEGMFRMAMPWRSRFENENGFADTISYFLMA